MILAKLGFNIVDDVMAYCRPFPHCTIMTAERQIISERLEHQLFNYWSQSSKTLPKNMRVSINVKVAPELAITTETLLPRVAQELATFSR